MKSKVLSILLLLSTLAAYPYTDVIKLDSETIAVSLTQLSPNTSQINLFGISNIIEKKIALKISQDGNEIIVEGHSKTATNKPNQEHPVYSDEFRTAFAKHIAFDGITANELLRNKVFKSGDSKEVKANGISFAYNEKEQILQITIPTQPTTVTQN